MLDPQVFGVYPRMDIIHANVEWQRQYNVVNYRHCKSVHEMIYMVSTMRKSNNLLIHILCV